MYMKRWAVIIAITLITIWMVVDAVCEFIANDSIRYFAVEPRRLLWVAAIGVGGGLMTLVFCRLSARLQRTVKLFAIGSAASCLTVFACCLLYQIAGLSLDLGVLPGPVFIKGVAWSFGGAALLWYEFYRVSKRRVT